VTTRRELAAALEYAVTHRGKFQLIEIALSVDAISPTLRRFVEAQSRHTGMKLER
jgi:TPP-dependent 2-oxoacid decarboxylase